MAGIASPTTFQTVKNVGRFIWGEWAGDVGKKLAKATKGQTFSEKVSTIMDFEWKKEYDIYIKSKDKAAAAAKTASKAAKKGAKGAKGAAKGAKAAAKTGLFGKLGGKIMPAFILLTEGMSVLSETREGGIGAGLKQAAKAAFGYLGATAGILLASAFIATTGWITIPASMIGFMVADAISKKVLGPSIAEQNEAAQAQQQELQNQLQQNLYGTNNSQLKQPNNMMMNPIFNQNLNTLDSIIQNKMSSPMYGFNNTYTSNGQPRNVYIA